MGTDGTYLATVLPSILAVSLGMAIAVAPLTTAVLSAVDEHHVGTASGINADVAEGYAVGQVAQLAVEATKGTDNAKIISYLHSGVTLQTVQGPVKFDSLGRNGVATTYIFQWQNGKYVQVLPVSTAGSVAILNPKPAWKS